MKSPFITGLRMKKVGADSQDLLTWKDGTVAVGMRKIGKGAIIEFGTKGDGVGSTPNMESLEAVLKNAGVAINRADVQVPDKPDASNLGDYFFRDYETNNGLYHVTAVWNPGASPLKLSINFHDKPINARDVITQKKLTVADGKLNLTLDPLQMRMFLTPRRELAQAGANWLDLQRKWWRAAKSVTEPFPKPDDRFVRSLNDQWAFHPLDEKQEPDAAKDFDDSKWPRIDLGAWNTEPARKDIHHAEMRRRLHRAGGVEQRHRAPVGRHRGVPDLRRRGARLFRWEGVEQHGRGGRREWQRSGRRADRGLDSRPYRGSTRQRPVEWTDRRYMDYLRAQARLDH